jgi:hypothetical protein
MTQPQRSADEPDDAHIPDNVTPLEDHGHRHTAVAHYALTAYEWWVAAAVGVWLAALGGASLVAVMWSWAVADRAGADGTAVQWIGPDFTATPATSALALAAVAGVTGSVVHSASLFATRVGRRTFEVSYVWWYVLRPVEAALVAVVLVAAVRSGLVALNTTGNEGATTALAFLVGGLAGLFTDRAMQRLRGLLGATKTDAKASEQAAPGTFATP